MRADEDLCRRALDSLLQEHGVQGNWSPGCEPPDWFLEVAGQEFAVEATSIHGLTAMGEKSYNWTKLSVELLAFGEAVCREVESKVNIPGCFFVSFPSMPNLKSRKSEIVQAIISYFETDEPREKPKNSIVLRVGKSEISVRKIGELGGSLIPQALPTGAFITRRDEQLESLLTTEIRKKLHKLRNVAEPVVLLVLDRYGFSRELSRSGKPAFPEKPIGLRRL
jgi:hypothetical protein